MQKTLYNRGYNGMLQLAVFVAMWGAGLIVGSLGAAAAAVTPASFTRAAFVLAILALVLSVK